MMDSEIDLGVLQPHRRVAAILSNGFEDRVPIGPQRLASRGFRCDHVVVVRYPGAEHEENYGKVKAAASAMLKPEKIVCDSAPAPASVIQALGDLASFDAVLCDISGISRALLLGMLTRLYEANVELFMLYTEAKEYYPLRADFDRFLRMADNSQAFSRLAEYEEGDVVYSASCRIEEIEELSGTSFPNHPLMLISFFTFKRSRLSAVLNQYETNSKLLIESEPVRRDLKWRKRALEIVNFDLIGENRINVVSLPTLYWRQTYDFLADTYSKNGLGYRYNIILAPLGGKMQTVGAWRFAVDYPDVKVVTSTPDKHFPDKYSIGYTHSHIFPMPRLLRSGDGSTAR